MKWNRLQQSEIAGKRRLRLGCLFLAVLMSLTLSVTVSAETAKEKYERLKGELAGIGEQIETAKDKQQSAEQQRAALAQQRATVEELIRLNQENIAQTQADLEAKEAEIALKRQVIYENDQLFQQRLVAIYKMNDSSMLSRALTVDNFSELLQMVDALQRISKHDSDLLTLLAQERAALETQQAEIDAILAELEAAYADLASQAEVLAGNIAAQDAAISQAQAEVAAQEQAYDNKEDEVAAAKAAYDAMLAATRYMGGSSSGDGSQYVGGVFIWPVPTSYRITCHFGAADPAGRGHLGMDIGAPSGDQILAAGDGTVITATSHSSYGNYVIIDHGDGVKTLYAHASQLLVGVGTPVAQGTPIALVGSTGFSTGPHLHFEVHANGGRQNPLSYLQG